MRLSIPALTPNSPVMPAAAPAIPAPHAERAPNAVSAVEADPPERICDRVREARTRANMTKADLARRVGVCISAAVQWENRNGTSPTVANLARIAQISQVSFEWLATGRGSRNLALGDAGGDADVEFESRLLQAAREISRDHRERVIEFARKMIAG